MRVAVEDTVDKHLFQKNFGTKLSYGGGINPQPAQSFEIVHFHAIEVVHDEHPCRAQVSIYPRG